MARLDTSRNWTGGGLRVPVRITPEGTFETLPAARALHGSPISRSSRHRTLAGLSLAVGVLLVAAFFRLWRLDSIPPGLHYDVAFDGIDARDVLAGHLAVFFPRNNGREPLFIYFLALMLRFSGLHPFTFAFSSAAMGILGVATTYALWRELFDWRIAFVATLLLAVSFWDVSMSRLGFRAAMLLPFLNLTLYFLWKTLHSKRLLWPALAGLSLGVAQYTYTSARVLPLLVALCCLCMWRRSRERLTALATMACVAAAVFVPEAVYFVRHPAEFLLRSQQVTLLGNPDPLRDIQRLGSSAANTAAMFFVRGDGDPMHNVMGLPAMGGWEAALFLAGIAIVVARFRRQPAARWVICIFVVMLLPTMFATGAPNYLRALGAAPATFLFPGAAIDAVLALLRRRPMLYTALASVIVAPVALRDSAAYFNDWASAPDTYGALDTSRIHEVKLLAEQHVTRKYFADSDITGKIVRLFLPATEQDGWIPEASAAIPIPSHVQGDTLYVGMTNAALNRLVPAWLPGVQPLPQPNNPLGKPDFTAFVWSQASASEFLSQFAAVNSSMDDFELAAYAVRQNSHAVILDVLWRPVRPIGPYDMYVHLADENGRQVGASDRLVWPVKDFARTPEGSAPFKWGYFNEGSFTSDWLLTEHTITAPAGKYVAEIGLARRDAANPDHVSDSLGSIRVGVRVGH